MDFRELLRYCTTDGQKEILRLLDSGMTQRQVADTLGRNIRNVERSLARIRKMANRMGYDPDVDMLHHQGIPVKGTSTLYDEDGKVRLSWVKTNRTNEELLDLMNEVVESMKESIPQCEESKDLPKKGKDELLNLHVLTDAHVGMLACHEETMDEDFDLKHATLLYKNWIDYSVENSPEAVEGVLLNIGDFLHYDSLEAVTPTSRHVLDTDTRFYKMVRLGIMLTRYMIRKMLTKYQRVRFIMCDSNHSPAGGIWLAEFFKVYYENEKRVDVCTKPTTYKAVQWGKTMICAHHGHKRSITKGLDAVMASNYPEMFGSTEWRYCHVGHFHHDKSEETALMLMRQHRTLAPKDGYAASGGWMSKRSADVITYHKVYGEVNRITIVPEMLK